MIGEGLAGLGRYALFVRRLGRALWQHGISREAAVAEAYQIGVRSMPILLVIGAFVGTNLTLQGYAAFQPLGGRRLVGMFVALAGVRELAPIIAASMVAAKAGTEMASQLGVMRIQEQIDALEVMAVNPLAHLVGPRLVGIMLVLPALTLISIFTMLCAAYLVAVFQLNLNGRTFLHFAADGIAPLDFVYAMLKALVFGGVICTISCLSGLRCGPGPVGVGQATNRAVVASAVACVILNYLMSEVLYGGQGGATP